MEKQKQTKNHRDSERVNPNPRSPTFESDPWNSHSSSENTAGSMLSSRPPEALWPARHWGIQSLVAKQGPPDDVRLFLNIDTKVVTFL